MSPESESGPQFRDVLAEERWVKLMFDALRLFDFGPTRIQDVVQITGDPTWRGPPTRWSTTEVLPRRLFDLKGAVASELPYMIVDG